MKLEISGLTKRYGTQAALDALDLHVTGGRVLVLVGPSGGGKSTLLRVLGGLEKADEGRVLIRGKELPSNESGLLAYRRAHGFLFQQFNLFPHLCALDNVALPLRKVQRMSKAKAREKAAIALRRVGLIDRAANYPAELSGGQQQRVAIARALALDPEVILFDEPTSALDPELVGEVLKTMREVAETGMTMVVVTHELGFAREVGDLNVFMEDGRIVESGPRGFYDNCKSERAREFLKAVM